LNADYFLPMSNQDFLRRAFELADTGEYSSVGDIRKVLVQERFTLRELSQLGGKQLAQQLRDRIKAARRTKDAG
jgi:hypothetical protein